MVSDSALIDDLYNAFDPYQPLPPNHPAYVDCTAVRGESNILVDLGNRRGAIAFLYLSALFGTSGCGKVYGVASFEGEFECYEQDLQIFRQLGDRHGEGQTLANLGLLYKKRGNLKQAISLWQEALTKLHPDSPEIQAVRQWL